MILRVAFISALAALAVQMVGLELMTRYGLEDEVEAFLGTTAKTPSVPITGRRQLLSSPGGWNSDYGGSYWDLSPADPTQSSCAGYCSLVEDVSCSTSISEQYYADNCEPPEDGAATTVAPFAGNTGPGSWTGCPANSMPPSGEVCLSHVSGFEQTNSPNENGCIDTQCCAEVFDEDGDRTDDIGGCLPGYTMHIGNVCKEWSRGNKQHKKYHSSHSICCVPDDNILLDVTIVDEPNGDRTVSCYDGYGTDGDGSWATGPTSTYYEFSNVSFAGGGNCDGGGGGALFGFIWLFIFFGPTILAAVISCYCYNKSMNSAPFNGDPAPTFPRTAKAVPQVAQMQVVQMQCPADAQPGTLLQSNINGQTMNIAVPAGVAPGTMFSVQVPVTPAAPVTATTANPLAGGADSSGPGSDTILPQLNGLEIQQVLHLMEAVSGCETKNSYQVYEWDGNDDSERGQHAFTITEESDSCEKICCKQQRALMLKVHETTGGNNQDVLMSMSNDTKADGKIHQAPLAACTAGAATAL